MAGRGQPPTRQRAKINVAALARQYGPKAIERLAAAMDSEDERVAIDAASKLLDRGYGKPLQTTADLTNKLDELSDDIISTALTILGGADDASEDVGDGAGETSRLQ